MKKPKMKCHIGYRVERRASRGRGWRPVGRVLRTLADAQAIHAKTARSFPDARLVRETIVAVTEVL